MSDIILEPCLGVERERKIENRYSVLFQRFVHSPLGNSRGVEME